MRGETQTILATPEQNAQGIYGNCLQAAVASLLDRPLDAVPHFGAFARWSEALYLWAQGEGLIVSEGVCTDIPQDRCLVIGQSPRNFTFGHACVGEHGQVVWDPHPSRAGLASVHRYFTFEVAS